MKRYKNVLTLSLLISCVIFISAQDDFESKLLSQFHNITSEEMMTWVEKLCSPEFNGRLTGTPEYIASAEWVADKLKEWGIKPAGDNGSYFQWFGQPYTVVNDIGSLSMNLTQPDGSVIIKNYNYPEEYYPGMNSGNGEVTAEVVFAGFGVTAPELNYDDYKGIDVKGKIVLVNRDVPHTDPRNPEYKKWVGYCYHQYKLENAVKHGAAGFLYIDGASANPNISYSPSIIVCGIGPQPLSDIFAGLKTTNAELTEKMRKTFRPASFSTGKVMTIKANTTRFPEGKGCNVIGLIEGTDPMFSKEVIIIGGHLDAVGKAGKVVNGALDNASGIVDIMGAAKAMAQSGIRLKRSVMFLFIGGEENGLIGSRLYTQKPVFPKEKTTVFINLDMVGNGTGLSVSTSGPYKRLVTYFEEANSKYIHRPFRGSAPEPVQYYGRPRSDSFNFSSIGYPTMSIGTTGAFKKVYYHLPGDDPDAITIGIMEDVAKMIYIALTNMANDETLMFE
ncbi:MAG: M20/M25/M40 family metallo-hydrolase [Bacteroidales bacterium]|nr:M20/M25/M40 family metallo-hydrolase [Bacteroidales bacterium]